VCESVVSVRNLCLGNTVFRDVILCVRECGWR
jgi:hypothetical protein